MNAVQSLYNSIHKSFQETTGGLDLTAIILTIICIYARYKFPQSDTKMEHPAIERRQIAFRWKIRREEHRLFDKIIKDFKDSVPEDMQHLLIQAPIKTGGLS
jgi:hypothetical protein